MHTRRNKTAWYGVLTALGMVLGYVEHLIPISIGVPGVKIGLANLVSFFALFHMGARDALALSVARVVLTGLTFGNLYSMVYGMAGALVSLFVMWVCKKRAWFGPVGVSMAGGIAHNLGQLVVAAFVVENASVFAYFPVLLLAGAAAGALVGLLGGLVEKRLPVFPQDGG